jgi:hypothetical protein
VSEVAPAHDKHWDLSVVTNFKHQVLILPYQKWPNGLPMELIFRKTAHHIQVFDEEEVFVGYIPLEAYDDLMEAYSFYVATHVLGIIKSQGQVTVSWRE